MSGYTKMRRALAASMLSRPRGLWERLTFPLLRESFKQGFEQGYATGHIDGQHAGEATGADS